MMETILSRCIKVTLQAPTGIDVHAPPEETALLEMLSRHAREQQNTAEPASVPAAYRLLREFTGLLAAARARLQAEADDALEREEKHYAQTTDGAWLAEREAYHKAVVGGALRRRPRPKLVEGLARWWGDALRCQTGGRGEQRCRRNRRARPPSVLRRKSCAGWRRWRRCAKIMDRNIQEALALEVAFLQVFGT